jgi:magnesium and cobalt transporter
VPHRGETYELAGLRFVVLHTRAGVVRWFKVSPVTPLAPVPTVQSGPTA